MDIKCTTCGAVKHFKPSAAAEIDQTIYRCRPCFLAASGARSVACRRCGKVRKYDRTHFKKLDLELCRDCYNAKRREQYVTITCLRCGKSEEVPPSQVKRRRDGVNCVGCAKVYDTSIPETYSAGYVTGAILGDGYLTKGAVNGSPVFGLRLDVTSVAFADEFSKHVAECTGGKPWRGHKLKKYHAGALPGMPDSGEYEVFIAAIGSREWYEKLAPLKHGRRFDLIRHRNIEFRRGFVQGMIDSEGYVNAKYTDVANKDLELLGLLREFLVSLGYHARVYGPYPYARGVAHLRVNRPLHKNQ